MTAREQAQLRDEQARRRLGLEDERQATRQAESVRGRARYRALTPLQREAAGLWADGRTLRQIAAELGHASHGAAASAVKEARRKLQVPRLRPTLARHVLRYALDLDDKEAA